MLRKIAIVVIVLGIALPAQADTGDIRLIDSSGLEWFINSDITFTTSESASGAASDASYTTSVAATTNGGGTTMTDLDDAFDGYNGLIVNGTTYNMNGTPAAFEAGGREVVFRTQNIGGLEVFRKVFVPVNDEFCRWLDVITNTTAVDVAVSVSKANNLGSDSSTTIEDSSDGVKGTASVQDNWVVTNGDDGDPRLGHVLQGPGARVTLSAINFQEGDDTPTWSYNFNLGAGATAIIMNFATGQPSIAQARGKSIDLAELRGSALDDLTETEIEQIANFVATGGAGKIPGCAAGFNGAPSTFPLADLAFMGFVLAALTLTAPLRKVWRRVS